MLRTTDRRCELLTRSASCSSLGSCDADDSSRWRNFLSQSEATETSLENCLIIGNLKLACLELSSWPSFYDQDRQNKLKIQSRGRVITSRYQLPKSAVRTSPSATISNLSILSVNCPENQYRKKNDAGNSQSTFLSSTDINSKFQVLSRSVSWEIVNYHLYG